MDSIMTNLETEIMEDKPEMVPEIEEVELKEPEVIERPYTLRPLKDADLYPILRILKKMGVDKKNLQGIVQEYRVNGKEKSTEEIGASAILDVASLIIGNIPVVETELYELWSDISGIPADDIREMEFGTLPLMIMDTFKGVKNTSFFKVLFKLL